MFTLTLTLTVKVTVTVGWLVGIFLSFLKQMEREEDEVLSRVEEAKKTKTFRFDGILFGKKCFIKVEQNHYCFSNPTITHFLVSLKVVVYPSFVTL